MVVASALTAAVRTYCLRREVLDAPNARSMHAAPTPRGGGVAIAVVVVATTLVLAVTGLLQWRPAVAVLLATLLLAALGWLDDMSGLSRRLRFGAQVALVALLILLLEPELPRWLDRLGGVGQFLVLLVGGAWFINLYNFMDGIDGLAAGQGLVAALWLAAAFVSADEPGLAMLCLGLAGGCAGFLRHNWAPASIFLGDAGSATLGGLFLVLMFAGTRLSETAVAAFGCLFAVFLLDATLTLLTRVGRGEPFLSAHREHAYQRLARRLNSHAAASRYLLRVSLLAAGAGWLAWVSGSAAVWALPGTFLIIAALWVFVHFSYQAHVEST